MPARRASGLVHGTPPSTAKSTLNAPGPRRNRVKARAIRARQPVAQDVGHRRRGQIEHRDVGRRQLRRRLDPDAGLDLAAQIAQQRRHRVGDRLRSARRHRPAVPVAGGDDAQPDRRGHRVVQRPEGMCRNASEQRPRRSGAEQPGAARTREAPWAAPNRASVSGWCGTRSSGPMMSSRQRVEVRRRLAERQPPPRPVAAEAGRGLVHRAVQHAGAAVVEGCTQSISGHRHDRPYRSSSRLFRNVRADGHRVDRRAVVVQQAGHDGLAAAGAAADLVGGLQHGDLTPLAARAMAAASPLGPPPTTTAVLMPRAPCRGRLDGRQRPCHLQRDGAVGQPGLFGDRVGHLPGAALDHPERGVDQLVVLDSAAERPPTPPRR